MKRYKVELKRHTTNHYTQEPWTRNESVDIPTFYIEAEDLDDAGVMLKTLLDRLQVRREDFWYLRMEGAGELHLEEPT